MATIADLKRALIQADSAGDTEAAGVFANEIKKAQAQGMGDTSQFLPPKANKSSSLSDKLIGAGETALTLGTGATGGLVGAVGGTLKGLAESIASGKYGTQEGANLVKQEQEEGAKALTYAPRTQAGQEMVGATAEALSPLQAFPMMSEWDQIATIAKAARPGVSLKTTQAGQALKQVTKDAMPSLVPKVDTVAVEAAQAAENLGIPVMTSDIAKPQTFIGKSAQMAAERIPLVGTGALRETQQAKRVQAIKDIAQEFKADSPLIELEGSVMSDLAKTRGDEVVKYAQMKKEIFNKTSGSPMDVSNATNAIDSQIARLQGLKSSEVTPVVSSLEDFKQAIQGQDIKNVEELRKVLGDKFKSPDMVSVKSVGDKAVSDIYGALKKDMENHIVNFGDRRDVTKWNVANKKLSIMMGELDNNALKYTLKKGNVTPEVITRMLYSKKPSDTQMLFKNLSPIGKQNARSAILGKVFQDSLNADGQVSTAKFLTGLDKMDENTKVFFKGEDKATLDGLKKALALTRRAEEAKLITPTGQQLYPAAMAGAAGAMGGIGGLFGLGTIGMIARAYESAPVKNALLRMSKASSRAEQGAALEKLQQAVSKNSNGKF